MMQRGEKKIEVEQYPVLVVEDNDDDLFIFKKVFKDSNLANPVHAVTDGLQARDYLSGSGDFADRTANPFPFLVFLDLKLPYLSGLEILEWIQQQPFKSDLHVVVLTSSDEERDITRAYHLGARSYLTKPATAKALREIMAALNESLITKQLIRRLPLTGDLFARPIQQKH